VSTIDFFPGASPARFGRFVGGVISGTTTAPSPVLRAEAAAGLFEANAFVESPIGDRSTAMVAGRVGYPSLLLSLFAPGISLAYWDYTARITHSLTPVDTLSIFAIGASDREQDPAEQIIPVASQFHRIDLRFDHRWTGGSVRVATTFGHDWTSQEYSPASSEVAMETSGRFRVELEQHLGERARLSAGADLAAARDSREYTGIVPQSGPLDLEQIAGAYAEIALRPARGVEVVPGLRLDAYHSPGTVTPSIDPRLAARIATGPNATSITSFAVAHQEPTFAIPSPGLRLDASGGLQQVVQFAQGAELRLPWDLTTSVTGFYHLDHHMSDLLLDCGTFAWSCGAVQRVNGRTYGLEVLLQRSLTRRLGGWLAYTLSRAERNGPAATSFLSPFDRTHVLSAVLRYDLGSGLSAGLRATYYSGRPETPNVSIAGSSVDFAFGPEQFAQHRLPDFYRVDVRVEKRWELGRRRWIAAVLEFFNATLSKEPIDYQCDPTTWVCRARDIGPVSLPSIGLEGGL
jgi:hypothetical protein